jgi:hypothetical protein
MKLIAGILVAWVLGGILEELAFRGIVLRSIELWLRAWLGVPIAAACAVWLAASGAGVIHIYQGSRGRDSSATFRSFRRFVCHQRIQSLGRHIVPWTVRHRRFHSVCKQEIQVFEPSRIRKKDRFSPESAVG